MSVHRIKLCGAICVGLFSCLLWAGAVTLCWPQSWVNKPSLSAQNQRKEHIVCPFSGVKNPPVVLANAPSKCYDGARRGGRNATALHYPIYRSLPSIVGLSSRKSNNYRSKKPIFNSLDELTRRTAFITTFRESPDLGEQHIERWLKLLRSVAEWKGLVVVATVNASKYNHLANEYDAGTY